MSDDWSSRLRSVAGSLSWPPPVRPAHLAEGDEVVLDKRRHPITLVVPALRSLLGLALLTTSGATVQFVILFAFSVAAWAFARLHARPTRSLLVGGAVAVLLLIASAGLAAIVAGIALTLWLVEDIAHWCTDRLVVSRKRIYRLYGVLTRHSPSMALTSVTFIDALQSPLGRALGYGTVLLDSVAQRDEPLSRFDHLRDAEKVQVRILELRTAAMPRYPSSGSPTY